jgi:hypothetical protein
MAAVIAAAMGIKGDHGVSPITDAMYRGDIVKVNQKKI